MELQLNASDIAAMLRGHAQALADALQNPTSIDPVILTAHTARMNEIAEHLSKSIHAMRVANSDHPQTNGAKAA